MEQFKNFTLKEIENTVTAYDKEWRKTLTGFRWKIKARSDSGIDETNRNNSTLQKDWAILKAYELPKDLNFVVRGHKGWDRNMDKVPYALTVSIEVLNATIPIYEAIRN